MTREMLLEKSLDDLRQIARALNVKSVTKYRKSELADIIMNQGRSAQEKPEKPAPAGKRAQDAEQAKPKRGRGRPRKAETAPAPESAEQPAQPAQPAEPAPPAEPEKEQPAKQAAKAAVPEVDYAPRRRGRPKRAMNDPAPLSRDAQADPPAAGREPARDYAHRQYDRPQYYNPEYGTNNPAVSEMIEAGECGDAEGILEIAGEGFGFLRCENFLPGPGDVYISNAQIRRFRLKTGDKVAGKTRPCRENDKYPALLYITAVNDCPPEDVLGRRAFEELVPIFPNERFTLESRAASGSERLAIRLIDLMCPIGRGQRGLIVSQPKAGKTTLLKNIANGISKNYKDVELIVLLIDERPEEVTDMQRSIDGTVVYSTFDELPERHTRVAELVMEHSMRLVEQGRDVVVLLDSITRLARAYNLTITPTGRTLSGGMDPGALYKPKRFFGAARNIENGGSLTVIATALIETGSRMDDMVYEEFKGTGNMEIHLDRKLSERRIFPAIDIYKSGTRRDELLLSPGEAECAAMLRRMLSVGSVAEVTEEVIDMLNKTESNEAFLSAVKKLATAYEGRGGYSAGKGYMR